MTPPERSYDDVVLAAWAPAGWGRIVVVLGQGVVIHKFVVSLKAAAADIAQSVEIGAGGSLDDRDPAIADPAHVGDPRGSPFVDKVLRNGVSGLLASRRKTLIPWADITAIEYRGRALNRGRLTIRSGQGVRTLKFLQNTVVVGDPSAAFAHYLGDRFTDFSAD